MKAKIQKFCSKAVVVIHNFLTACISIARDPVKLWELGNTAALQYPAFIHLAPFSVTTSVNYGGDRLRKLRMADTPCCIWMPYFFIIVIGLRYLKYVSLGWDKHFHWLANGQFTTDSSLYLLFILFGAHALGGSCMLIKYKEEIAFLSNCTCQLNRNFSGKCSPC